MRIRLLYILASLCFSVITFGQVETKMHPAQLLQAGATNGQALVFNTTSGEWEASAVGLTINNTDNYFPKRLNATSFTNSLLYDNGASIGLATTSPNATFHIAQNTTSTKGLMVDNAGTGDATISLRITGVEEWLIGADNSTTSDNFVIANSGLLGVADRFVIDGLNGNIGIGSNPTTAKLYVGGGIGLSGLITLGTGMDANNQPVTNLLGETYGAGWNNDYSAAAKHDIYTKIETIGGGGADNLGNHTATQNIQMSGNWLSNDGGNEGVFVTTSGSVGINVSSVNTSAVLEAVSTTQGFLLPRMTTAQRTAIASPANGLKVFDTSDGIEYIYTSSAWWPQGDAGIATEVTANATATMFKTLPVVGGSTITINPPTGTPTAGDWFTVSASRGGVSITNPIIIDFVTKGENLHGIAENYEFIELSNTTFLYINATTGWTIKQ